MNTARNEITGKVMKTSPQNSKYAEGWDRIFTKKSAHEWLKEIPNTTILDADGWRYDDGVTLDTPIKWSDFQKRLNESTINTKINEIQS